MKASLHDIAPRLARARDERRWELSVIDGDGFKVGDELRQLITSEHKVVRCLCGAKADRYRHRAKLLVGCNAGTTTLDTHEKCRGCGRGWYSNRPICFYAFEMVD